MVAKRVILGSATIGAVMLAMAASSAFAQAPPPPQGPAVPAAPAPMPEVLANYRPVTDEMLKNPAANDWLQIRRTYDGQAYSPLEQINTRNARNLKPAWIVSTGVANGHQAPPIVNNGVMFVSTPGNQVMALDAKDGTILWRYRIVPPEDAIIQHPTSRGIALHGDKVFFAAGHAVLVALDAKTGKEVWKTTVADNKSGYYMSLAPLVADGKVMVGTSGGERGVRGYIAAYDVEKGAEVWRSYMVPAPGEPGSETWPEGGEQWKTGGAPVWITGNYDSNTNVSYWGTGNGGPWMGDRRPGDNLYVTSVVAVDVANGKIVGHHQYHPNDSWDWDEVSPPILLDFTQNGKKVTGLLNFARNGYMWWLEREATGKINFVKAQPFVHQDVFKSVDPVTGRPDVDDARKPGTGKRAEFCPSHWGGKDWPPVAFSPKTRLVYVPANENLCSSMIGQPVTYRPGQPFSGAQSVMYFSTPNPTHIGEVQAWNVDTGKKVWTHEFATSQNWGPTMVTAGNVVFGGGTNDRKFRAFDATNGKVLWEMATNSGITGMPSTYMVDGKQYVAVMAGWGVDARGMQNRLNALRPGQYPEVPEGGAIWVFALP
jgi:alcohol dehydrogenase (cytochrome c)